MSQIQRHSHLHYTSSENNSHVIWGLVLARKNSKRLPGKNTRMLAGKPMIAYTFEAAIGSHALERTWIFSDDEEALSLAKAAGIHVPAFERPERVSNDQATTEETVHYFLSQFPEEQLPDYLVLLQATSPLRTSQDIDDAVKTLLGHSTLQPEGLVSVYRPAKPLEWLYEQHPNVLTLSPMAHDSTHWKMPNGAIYILKPKTLLSGEPIFKKEIIGYDMPWQRSIDIDTLEDFLYAEALLNYQKHQSTVEPT